MKPEYRYRTCELSSTGLDAHNQSHPPKGAQRGWLTPSSGATLPAPARRVDNSAAKGDLKTSGKKVTLKG
jgi:hypothetical protein